MINITAIRIMVIPMARRAVNVSPNIVTPIITAVRGSSAPIMAVGVEPMYFTDSVIMMSDITVGPSASIEANPHIDGVVSICNLPFSLNRENADMVSIQNIST